LYQPYAFSVTIGEKNEFNYCVASQDYALREKLRLIPGVPLIYEKRSVLIVEPVSAATQLAVQKVSFITAGYII
jgi:U3 small nucleolar RNA-associated protein 23